MSSGVNNALETVRIIRDWWSEDVRKLEKLVKDANPSALTEVEDIFVEQLHDEWKEAGNKYKWYTSSARTSRRLFFLHVSL